MKLTKLSPAPGRMEAPASAHRAWRWCALLRSLSPVFGGLLKGGALARVTRDRRTQILMPHPSRPGSMVAFVGLPAFLILLTLVSVPLRIFPVGVRQSPAVEGAARAGDESPSAGGAEGISSPVVRGVTDATGSPDRGPCEPRTRVLEIARRAAGPAYRQDVAPRM
jgi:hypothetical protein